VIAIRSRVRRRVQVSQNITGVIMKDTGVVSLDCSFIVKWFGFTRETWLMSTHHDRR
jgi:hypothetical protein